MLAATLAATTIARAAAAQERETVYLKSGGRIDGQPVEFLPGKYVSVLIADGQVRKVSWSAVDHVRDASDSSASKPVRNATLVIDSTKPVTRIQRITSHSAAIASGPGGTAAVSGITWVNLCQAPCKLKLPAGLIELQLDGPYPPATETFNLHPGVNHVVVKPGSSFLDTTGGLLTVLGFTSALLAGGSWALAAGMRHHGVDKKTYDQVVRIAMPITFAGLGAGVVGIGFSIAGSSSMQRGHEPPVRDQARMVTVHGTF